MIKLVPILLIILASVVMIRFSAWRMGRDLRARSKRFSHDQLDRLTARLAKAAGIDRIEARILEDDTVNGLATPGGEIYITRGLFRHFQSGRISAEEIASVIAHELGHLALGHTKRRMVEVSVAQTATMIVGGILARVIPFVGFYLAQFLASLFVTRLSRRDEFEADAYATALMMKAGFSEEHQARMLEKLEDITPARKGMTEVAWLASHPPIAERTAAIRTNAQRWRETRAGAAG